MLDFIEEENSGQLVAYSETTIGKSYWIDEGVWTYLTVVRGDRAGPNFDMTATFYDLDEAKAAAETMEVADNEE